MDLDSHILYNKQRIAFGLSFFIPMRSGRNYFFVMLKVVEASAAPSMKTSTLYVPGMRVSVTS